MKLAMFDDGSPPRTGIVVGGQIIPTGLPGSMIDFIAHWEEVEADLRDRAASGAGAPLSSVRLLPPVSRPGKIFAIGLNYVDHIAETQSETPREQIWFTKAVTSVNGPFDPAQIPRISQFVDYEVELVAVIGRRGRHIAREDAASQVFGYCGGSPEARRRRALRHRRPGSHRKQVRGRGLSCPI